MEQRQLLCASCLPRHCRLLGNGELKQVAEIMGKLVETLGLELQVSQSHSAAEIYIGYIGYIG
jgi:hypothetical protein